MAEKVVTEAFLRRRLLHDIPAVFYLEEGQILTPAAAQFLRDRRIPVEQGGVSPCPAGNLSSPATQDLEKFVARVRRQLDPGGRMIPVELSARHVHLGPEDVQRLFGHDLTPERELSQPGQYLSRERVRLIGPKGMLEQVAVLGPARGDSQVEISLTDARRLGIAPPVRQSGDISGTPGLQIATERDSILLSGGLMIPGRHIHMHPDDAQSFQVRDQQRVRVRVGDVRALIFEEVLVRVNPAYRLAMHIDFDEGNACGWNPETTGHLLDNDAGADG